MQIFRFPGLRPWMRAVRCRLQGHFPDFARRYGANRGLDFATCLVCGRDIVKETRGDWGLPPRGTRVVWGESRNDDLHGDPEPSSDILAKASANSQST